jgi:hypothetical protein
VFLAGQCAVSCCAPMEREPNSVTSGYKHLAPPGANRQTTFCCTCKLNPPFMVHEDPGSAG